MTSGGLRANHWQPLQNFERGSRFQSTTAPDIGYIACYAQFYSINSLSIFVFIKLSLGRR